MILPLFEKPRTEAIRRCAESRGLSLDDILGPQGSRAPVVTRARTAAVVVLREQFAMSFPEIADFLSLGTATVQDHYHRRGLDGSPREWEAAR